MFRAYVRSVAVFGLMAAMGVCVSAQNPPPSPEPPPPRDRPAATPRDPQPPVATERGETTTRDQRAPQARRVKNVLGTKVRIQGDLAIGTVDDIVFNDDGYIDYLVVLN